MSLLMKALEKAAQDRGNTTTPAKAAELLSAAPAVGGNSLSLEPIEPAMSSRSAEPEKPAPSPKAAAQPAKPGSPTTARPAPQDNEQARASMVMQARRSGTGGIVNWVQTRPLVAFGSFAGVFLLGYGIYIYLQLAHPGLFTKRAPAANPSPVVTAPPPTPAANTQAAPVNAADTISGSTLPSLQSVLGNRDRPADASDKSVALTAPAKPAAAPQTGAVASATPVAAAQSSAPVAQQQRITVSRGDSNAPRVNPTTADAYAALEAGRLDEAQRLYGQSLRTDPNNIDTLLGLASIAQLENKTDEASKYYLRVLELDPRHALAQSGLIAMLGRADPLAAETRLKQLASREPSPFLYFTLGNLYADQGQWAQAQQAYFQAHSLDAANPDYAYNLAVGLEHLGQQKLALGFYRRAVQLASARGRANFNVSQAQDRVNQLAARAE